MSFDELVRKARDDYQRYNPESGYCEDIRDWALDYGLCAGARAVLNTILQTREGRVAYGDLDADAWRVAVENAAAQVESWAKGGAK